MWVNVARAADMHPDRTCVVRAGGRELALISTKAGLFAIDNTCPHSGGALGEGSVQNGVVTCPLHGWRFEAKSGRCLTEKRAPQGSYAVKVEDGAVFVEIPEPAAEPAASPAAWLEVAEASALRPGTLMKATLDGETVALAATRAGIFALADACAHEGGPLSEGSLDGTTLTCPLHGWKFEAKTGACLNEAGKRQRTFETKVENGKVYLRRAGAAPAVATPAPETQLSPAEKWKRAKHGFDVWPDVLRHAHDKTPMSKVADADLERMKWYGFFYRKNNDNDRYMVRIRIPGCEMTAAQAKAVSYIAYESGYSLVDVTTRGNVQIQGLTIDKLPAVRTALERVGLTSLQTGHDNVRNVTSHPLSGVDPEEWIDTRALARNVQDMLIGSRELSDLPRKANVAFYGRPDAPAHVWTQDISFVAARGPSGELGFQLLLAGTQGQSPRLAWPIPVFVRPEQTVDVTAAILHAFRDLGYRHNRNQVRMRFLVERIGPDGMLLETEKRLGYELTRFPHPAPPPALNEDTVGWHRQKQPGRWAMGVCVPVGRITAEALDGLAVVAAQLGDGHLRTTLDQNLVLTGIPEAARAQAGYAVAGLGLTHEPDSLTRNMVACTGKQFCNIAVTETKGYAYQLIEELRRRTLQLHGISIHMSGCPSSCAMTFTADIGLKGLKIRRGLRVLDAFDVYLGGGLMHGVQMGMLYSKSVPFDQLPQAIESIVAEFYLKRVADQTFSDYWQGRLRGHKAEPLEQDLPRWACTRCRHIHVAADPPPFCPVCAAIRSKFEPAGEGEVAPASPGAAAPAAAEPDEPAVTVPAAPPRRIVIIGGGIGGHAAAQAVRDADERAHITLVTDEVHTFYNRLNLTRLLAQEVTRNELFDYDADWYATRRIDVVKDSRAIGLDPIQKNVLLAEGRELPYDSLVLAHGSAPATPAFYRPTPGVWLLRTLEDIDGILKGCRPGVRAVVIGGGVLGIEAAWGLKSRGVSVEILERFPRLMARQLDAQAAALLAERLAAKGLPSSCSAEVRQIKNGGEGLTVVLGSGRTIGVDIVVICTGIRPNTDWVNRSGVRTATGILVDDRMATSAPDVYAAGDVAEWRGQVIGLWANALDQAKVAGTNAAGGFAFFEGSIPVTILKCVGVPVVSIGEIVEDGPGIESRIDQDAAAGTYRRVVFRRGIPIGGLLFGSSAGMGELRKLIENGRELERLRDQVLPAADLAGTPA